MPAPADSLKQTSWAAAGELLKQCSTAALLRVTSAEESANGRDLQCIRRLQQGESDALDELMERYAALLFSFLCRRVSPRETAEDLFQETWLRVVEHCGKFRGNAPLKAWLFRIALNVLTDHYRRQSAERRGGTSKHVSLEGESIRTGSPQVPDAQENAVFREQQDELYRAVAALPDPFREVVRLRYFEELSTAEVAAVLECREGTIKSRLSRGLKLLQQQLREASDD